MPVIQVTYCQGLGAVFKDAPEYGLRAGDDIPTDLPADTFLQVETQSNPFVAVTVARYKPLLDGSSAWPIRNTIRPPAHPYREGLAKT